MLNAWGAEDEKGIGAGQIIVKVKKPGSNSSREIRNIILRDEFYYTAFDIEAFNLKFGETYTIIQKGMVNGWATAAQVKNWKVGAADGLTSITLSAGWVETAEQFRNDRIKTVIEQSAGAIFDADSQKRFLDDLPKILQSAGSERLTALTDLVSSASGPPTVSKQIYDALSYLSAQGYSDHPLIQFVRAKAMAGSAGGNVNDISARLAEALQAVRNRQSSKTAKPHLSVTELELAYINREAAYMYSQIGNDTEFQERDWIARFYAMNREEKSLLKAGDGKYLLSE